MIAALALMLAAQAAVPGITHIECHYERNGTQRQWNMTLNEPQGYVEYSAGPDELRRVPAVFLADEVRFMEFTISRVDLSLTTRGRNGVQKDQCQIAKPKQRAF